MSEPKTTRRIFAPATLDVQPAKQVTDVTIILAPTVNTLTSDALSIIQTEIARFKHKSNAGKLDQNDHRTIQGYLKSLVELDKMVKGREDDMDLANASDDELLKLVDNLRNKKQTTGAKS